MQSIKSFIINCNSHPGKKIGFVCLKPGCKNRLICSKCSNGHDNSHEKFFISIVEMFSSDLDAQCEEALKLTWEMSQEVSEARSELDIYLETLKIHLIEAIDEIREEIKASENLMNSDEVYASLQEAKFKVSEILELNHEDINKNKSELCEAYSKFKELQEKLVNRKPTATYTYDTTSYKKTKEAVFKLLKKTFKSTVGTPSKNWSWSTEKLSKELKVDNASGMVVLPPGNSGNHGILGDTVLTEGVHRWNIEIDPEIALGSWGIGFGIISKAQAEKISNWRSFPFREAICRSTAGNCENLKQIDKTNHRGKKTLCVLDFDQGTFEIWLDGEVVARNNEIKKGGEYIPFLDFNDDGFATLSFEA